MKKKPKSTKSNMSLKERISIARKALKKGGYDKDEIAKIIDKSFYETDNRRRDE